MSSCLFCTEGCEFCQVDNLPDWFFAGKTTPKSHINNVKFGRHPLGFKMGGEGVGQCRHCSNLVKKEFNGKVYYKCSIFGDTNGSASDVRVKWQGCVHWELKKD